MNQLDIFVITIVLLICSCSSDEDITGCTDPLGLNYNSEATVSSGCDYLSDPYLGSYNIAINNCTRDEELFINATALMQADDANPNDILLIMNGISAKPLQFIGEVNDSQISFNGMTNAFGSRAEEGFRYGNQTYLFPSFNLRGNLQGDPSSLTGSLAISAVNADDNNAQIFSTNCDFTLTK